MESWGSCALPSDSFTRSSKSPLGNWEVRASPSFGANNSLLTSSQPVNAGQAAGDSGSRGTPRKPGDSTVGALHGRAGGGRDRGGGFAPTGDAADGFFFGEEDFSSKLPGSVVDTSPVIDLKLGRLMDQRDDQGFGLTQGSQLLSSSESSAPSKRCRVGVVNNQAAYCQVYGCYKDLSSSKEYHKRHKVCEVHSKVPKVIVNGIEQRFCQQCSRFHLLCEFDDGKRSCRKRLAGHNQRRRKPQVGFHSPGRTAKFLLPYNAAVGNFHATNDWISHIKLDGRTKCSPLPITSSFQYMDFQPRVPDSSPSLEKSLCSYQESNRDNSATVSIFCNGPRYPVPSPMFVIDDQSLPSRELGSIFDTRSPVQGLSGISEPVCARSLLSSQSQNSSSHTSGVPMDKSLCQHIITQVSDSLVLKRVSDKFPSSMDTSWILPAAVSDSDSAGFEISEGVLHMSGFSNAKECVSGKEASTIDLLQLSSQLQRVEHERVP